MPEHRESETAHKGILNDEARRQQFRRYLIDNPAEQEKFIQDIFVIATEQFTAEPPARDRAENALG